MANKGSWFGLPDFGITEKIGQFLGATPTQQGGSNVIGGDVSRLSSVVSPVAQKQDMSSEWAGTPSTLGASTSNLLSNPQQTQQPQQQGNPFQDQGNASFDQAQAELNAALNEYDRQNSLLQNQLTSTQGQKESALSGIESQYGQAQKQAGAETLTAQENLTSQKQKALSTSQDVERKNRNMLRALGILSSSAAGEMLAKPGEEYATTSADLTTAFNKRKGQVDDWLNQRLEEANTSKTDIVRQFNDIVANINTDVRFNSQSKLQAVQAAQAALKENIAQLNTQAMQYQQAAQQYSQNMATQVAQLQLYQNPSANISGILSTLMTPQQTNYKPVQVGTLQPEKKDQYGNVLSG
jgi:hypothetical protein